MTTSKGLLSWRTCLSVLLAFGCLAPCLIAVGDDGGLLPLPAAEPAALRLSDLDGRDHSLRDLRGQVVLVNFWASWCPPCIEEMPSIQRLAERMDGRPFAVVGVNVGEPRLRVKSMVDRLNVRFPVLLDRESAVFGEWEVSVLPSTYVLDTAGVPRYLGRGAREWDADEIIELVERLMDSGRTTGRGYPPPKSRADSSR